MTRRPMIGLVAVAAAVTIALVYTAVSSPSAPPGLIANAGASGHPSSDAPTPSPTAAARSQARGLRLRAVLGDERQHRGARGEDAADDACPLLGDAHQDRHDQHDPDRLQADHRRDRQAADPRGARPGSGRPTGLHELRGRAQRALLRVARGPGRDHRGPRRTGRPDRGGRHQRRRRADRRRPRPGIRPVRRPLARRRCGRRTPTGWSRLRRRPAGPARRWRWLPARRVPTGSS